jgi:tRNA(Ile)-lysidine synthase
VDIQQKFIKNLNEIGVRKNDTFVLGISGGIDSVVMLDLFKNYSKKLIVAHLNHGVRKEAAVDEEFVRELAAKAGLTYVCGKIKKPGKGNLEEEMRILRQEFLADVAKKENAQFIVLAHNANDQAETVFLNLVRGSGSAGLAGMKQVSGKVIRPLLNISRKEIEKYARENSLKWHEDLSNKDIAYQRNYLRHELLPNLEKINPAWLEALNRTANLQRNIDDYLKTEAFRYLGENTGSLKSLPRPLMYEVFGLMYENIRGNRVDLTLQHLTELEKLIEKPEGTKKVVLPGKIVAVRRYDNLDFERENSYNLKSQPKALNLKSGSNTFGKWQIEVTKGKGKSSKKELFMDENLLAKTIVRTRKAGDKINTSYGQKKLQDLFVDAKINREQRDLWPVFWQGDKIIWVPGLAVNRDLRKEKAGVKINAKERDVQS